MAWSLWGPIRTASLLQWKNYVVASLILIAVALSVANVANDFNAVRNNLVSLQHTQAEYASNGMNFAEALKAPAEYERDASGGLSTSNLARADYDDLAGAIHVMDFSEGPAQVLKYVGLLVLPILFFFYAAQSATYGRRMRTEKFSFIRLGVVRSISSRLVTIIVFISATFIVAVGTDAIFRLIFRSILASNMSMSKYPLLSPIAETNWWGALPTLLLIWCAFGAFGYCAGVLFGGVAVPGILFVIYNFVVPVMGVFDPRTWESNLGHTFFDYSVGSFALFTPEPMSAAICLLLLTALGVIAILVSYLVTVRRNPLSR